MVKDGTHGGGQPSRAVLGQVASSCGVIADLNFDAASAECASNPRAGAGAGEWRFFVPSAPYTRALVIMPAAAALLVISRSVLPRAKTAPPFVNRRRQSNSQAWMCPIPTVDYSEQWDSSRTNDEGVRHIANRCRCECCGGVRWTLLRVQDGLD